MFQVSNKNYIRVSEAFASLPFLLSPYKMVNKPYKKSECNYMKHFIPISYCYLIQKFNKKILSQISKLKISGCGILIREDAV